MATAGTQAPIRASLHVVETKKGGPLVCDASIARPCPWCGEQPTIEFYHGGGPQKRLIACTSDACEAGPSVTGPTRRRALAAWNRRANSDRVVIDTGRSDCYVVTGITRIEVSHTDDAEFNGPRTCEVRLTALDAVLVPLPFDG